MEAIRVKDAYKATGPLRETTRANIRWNKDANSEVYMMEKRPLIQSRIDISPPQTKTFLMVEPGESALNAMQRAIDEKDAEVKALIKRVEGLDKRVEDLEADKQQRNDDLYRPLFSNRELAIVSLLMHQRDRLNALIFEEVQSKARELETDRERRFTNRKERKAAKKAFLEDFGGKRIKTYFQIAKASKCSNKKVVTDVLARVEQQFLQEYDSEGIDCDDSIDVRKSMLALRAAKKFRDQNAGHLFDYKYWEKGRASVQSEREAWQVQAAVLLDLQNAVDEKWLRGNFKTLGDPATGTLLLEIRRRIELLENQSGFSIKELAEKP